MEKDDKDEIGEGRTRDFPRSASLRASMLSQKLRAERCCGWRPMSYLAEVGREGQRFGFLWEQKKLSTSRPSLFPAQ